MPFTGVTARIMRREDLDSKIDRAACAALVHAPGSALLEGWSADGNWTILLPCPSEIVELGWSDAANWPELIRSLGCPEFRDDPMPAAPFLGGWVGFVAYDAGAITEGASPPDPPPIEPAAWFARHNSGLVIDPKGEAFVFGDESHVQRALNRLSLEKSVGSGEPGATSRAIRDSMADGRFASGVETIRELIRDGEVYQVNLTRELEVDRDVDPAPFYLVLTGSEPPRCSALLAGGSWTIASASPEVFLAYDRRTGVAESRPIKGTIRRIGNDDAEIAALLESGKDASEHLMIVDLVRNDFGKLAPAGHVTVPEFRAVRRLSYVYHLESTVHADELTGVALSDLLCALFPGGSITGAPKRAAVRAIRDLEPVARGVYTGALGYIDDRGRSAFSVAIRTAVIANRSVRYHAGGGIVWDSDPRAEDQEAITKAEPFLRQFEQETKP